MKIYIADGTFEDTQVVFNSLSDEEKALYGNSREESGTTVYRQLAFNESEEPVGYIELDDTSKLYGDNQLKDVSIGIAVNKDYRKNGIAAILLEKAYHWFLKSNYMSLTYVARTGNTASEALAIKSGFAYFWTTEDKEKIFIITNHTKIKL